MQKANDAITHCSSMFVLQVRYSYDLIISIVIEEQYFTMTEQNSSEIERSTVYANNYNNNRAARLIGTNFNGIAVVG